MSFILDGINHKETQKAVEDVLEKYRYLKFSFEEREASITASSEVRYHGPTNETSDQTGNIAIFNADQTRLREEFCGKVERAVSRLPKKERFLIEERYMTLDSDYVTDFHVYCHKFEPPISAGTYAKIRRKAFYRLALNLNLTAFQISENQSAI